MYVHICIICNYHVYSVCWFPVISYMYICSMFISVSAGSSGLTPTRAHVCTYVCVCV